MEKNSPLSELIQTTMEHVKATADANTIIGTPIEADGVTLIPVSKLSFGFGCGGGDYGKQATADRFGGGTTAAAKVEPMAFLVVKDGVTRVLPMGMPAQSTADRVIEMVPQVMDRVENYIDRKKETPEA